MNPRRLYRSSDDRIVAGVAAGVAAYFDVDPVIVRIIWFLSVFFTGSLTFWAYLVMLIVVPLEPSEWPPQSPWAPGGAPLGYPAYPAAGAAVAAGSAPASTDSAAGFANPFSTPPAGTAPAAAPGGAWSGDWRTLRRQERWQRREARRAARHNDGTPGLVFGLLLILAGGALAWHQFDPRIDLGLAWPVVVIVLGALLVVTSIRRDSSGG